MDKKRAMKLKKQLMVTWAVVGVACVLIIILTIFDLVNMIDLGFSPVAGILIPLMVGAAAFMQVKAYFKETAILYAPATAEDKKRVVEIFDGAKAAMLSQGIDQWDEIYPDINDYAKDIKQEEMTKVVVNGRIIGVYTLNKNQDPSYNFGNFTDVGENYVVLHRLCLAPEVWQLGYAAKILTHIEKTIVKESKNGAFAIRLDVFTKNPRALKLYETAGFTYVGDAYYRKGKFLLMEKVLNSGTSS